MDKDRPNRKKITVKIVKIIRNCRYNVKRIGLSTADMMFLLLVCLLKKVDV